MNNRASVDFVLYHRLDKRPVLGIEVDGYVYHEGNPDPRQQERDRLKNQIFEAYGLPLLRLGTIGSGEEQKIRKKLNEIVGNT